MSLQLMAMAWDVQDVSHVQKLVLLALCDCANDAGMCFPSVSRLSLKCSATDRAIQKAFSELETKGYLRRDWREGKSTIYWITPERSSPPNPVHPRTQFTPPPNVVHPTPERSSPINQREPKKEIKDVSSLRSETSKSAPTMREENNEPAATNPGSEGPHNAEPAQPAKKRKAGVKIGIRDWQGPSAECYQALQEAGINREFVDAQVREFVWYWEERGDKRPGWDRTFYGRVRELWERRPAKSGAPITRNQRGDYANKSRKFNAWEYLHGQRIAEECAGRETDFREDVIDLRPEVDFGAADAGTGR